NGTLPAVFRLEAGFKFRKMMSRNVVVGNDSAAALPQPASDDPACLRQLSRSQQDIVGPAGQRHLHRSDDVLACSKGIDHGRHVYIRADTEKIRSAELGSQL